MCKHFLCLTSLCVAIVLVIGSMGGCTNKPGDSGPAREPDLVVWHWMADREQAFSELARRYTQETGVRVEFHLTVPIDSYSQKVRAAVMSASLPDVFGVVSEPRDFAELIKAGFVEDMTPYLKADDAAWERQFYPQALKMDTFEVHNQFDVAPGIYGVPIDVMNMQFIYNKDLFRKAGLDPEVPPRTFEDFIAAGAKLKAAGIQGLVSGWGETWLLRALADNFSWNIMGQDKVLKTVKGEVPYTDPDWVRVFSLFQRMSQSGMLASGMVTMANKNAEQIFANQRAAIAFNGSWCVNVYKGMNPDLNFGAFLPPRITDTHPVVVWGGAGSSFKVNARSPQKEEAVTFLQWLTAKEQQEFLSEATLNLPANRAAAMDMSPVLKQFSSALDQAVHPHHLPYREYPRVLDALGKGLQLIIIGQKTPEQLAKELNQIKTEEIARDRIGSQ